MPPEDIDLICSVSRIILKGDAGDLKDQVKYARSIALAEFKQFERNRQVTTPSLQRIWSSTSTTVLAGLARMAKSMSFSLKTARILLCHG